MLRCFAFLMCCLPLGFVGCSKSEQPTAPTAAAPQSSLATVGPANVNQPNTKALDAQATKSNIDACALLTSKDIQSVQGEALKDAKPSGRSEVGFVISQCFYTLPTFTNSISLLVAQRGDSAGARDPKEFWRETFDRADESDKASEKVKDKVKGREEEAEKSVPPEKVAGVGDDAYWTGNRVGGAMYALKGNSYIRISVGGPGDQATKIKKAKALAQIILRHL
jgi:hypothetical protein